jgi:hypothetical protein
MNGIYDSKDNLDFGDERENSFLVARKVVGQTALGATYNVLTHCKQGSYL